jgi:transposase
MVIDGTHILSKSQGVNAAVPGYNSKNLFDPQVRVILIHSLDSSTPVYYRFLTGSLTDVSALSLTVQEAGIKDAIVVGDKGFHSEKNVKQLEKLGIHYVLPLKRNNSLIDYSNIQKGDKRNLGGYFLFHDRHIWYDEKAHNEGRRIVTFLDERLRAEEERCFLLHVDAKKKDLNEFYEKQYKQGTISIITDTDKTAQILYGLLKARGEIEQVIDTFKNTLHADRSYVRDNAQMEGWLFVNFIALQFYYSVYRHLMEKDLLKKYSVKDVLMHLSRVQRLKINEEWVLAEVPKRSGVLAGKLEMRIT